MEMSATPTGFAHGAYFTLLTILFACLGFVILPSRIYISTMWLPTKLLRHRVNVGLHTTYILLQCLVLTEDDDREAAEVVEVEDNVQYEIVPPNAATYGSYSDVSNGQAGFDDFVARHFLQRFSHLNLSRQIQISSLFVIPSS